MLEAFSRARFTGRPVSLDQRQNLRPDRHDGKIFDFVVPSVNKEAATRIQLALCVVIS